MSERATPPVDPSVVWAACEKFHASNVFNRGVNGVMPDVIAAAFAAQVEIGAAALRARDVVCEGRHNRDTCPCKDGHYFPEQWQDCQRCHIERGQPGVEWITQSYAGQSVPSCLRCADLRPYADLSESEREPYRATARYALGLEPA